MAKKKKTKTQVRAAKEARFKRIHIFSVIIGSVLAVAAVGTGFFYLEKYVKKVSPIALRTGQLEFPHESVPQWFNEELAALIRETAGGKTFKLDETCAERIGRKLKTLEWFEEFKVKTTKDSVRVTGKYRKPVAMIRVGNKKYCIAFKDELKEEKRTLVAMQYLNISKLPIVEITGSTLRNTQDISIQEDVKAAVKLIELLNAMDKKIKPVPPLLEEIARIDVSNYDGRIHPSKSQSHITLYLNDKNSTPIYWGSALGKTRGLIEAKDEDKLSALYQDYMEGDRNSLIDRNYTFIDLRNPRR